MEPQEQKLKMLNDELCQCREKLARVASELTERNKELDCLFEYSKIVSRVDSAEGFFNSTVKIFPQACQRPDLVGALILFDEKTYFSFPFEPHRKIWSVDIIMRDVKRGELQFYDLSAEQSEGVILIEEEQRLFSAIAERMGRVLDRLTTESALQKSRQQQRAILDNIPDIAWLKDTESKFIAVNNAFGKACGMKPKELVGLTDLDVFPKELAEAYRADDQEVMRSGQRKQVDEPFADHAGKVKWIETVKTAIYNEQGEVLGTAGISRDITERKLLAEKQQLFRAFIDNANDGFFVVEPETGRFLDVNDQACRELGYSREELLGLGVLDIDGGFKDQEGWQKHVRDMHDQGALIIETRHVRKDGSSYLTEINIRFIEIDGKEYIVAAARDVTKRKETEEQLDIFRKFAETSGQGLGMTTLDGKIVYANRTLSKLLGYDIPADATGTNIRQYYAGPWKELIEDEVFPMVLEADQWIGEIPLLSVKGIMISTLQNIFLLRDDKGQPAFFASVVTDISSRKRNEEALKISEERYRTLIENINIGVYRNTGGAQGVFLQANPAIARMFGYASVSEFMKVKVSELYQNAEDRRAFVEEIFATGRCKDRELLLKKKNGDPIYASCSAEVKYGENGEMLWMDGVIEDITDRKHAEEEGRKQKELLEQKNIALKEVLEQIEIEKKQIIDNVVTNAENLLMPLVEKLKLKGVSGKYVDLMRQNLEQLTSSFGRKISTTSAKLTPRETEICNLVKNGFTCKEVSEFLHISLHTVEKHRLNIRRKLGLNSQDQNLVSFLNRM